MTLTLLGIVSNTPRATFSLLISVDTFFQSTEPNPALGRTFYGLVSLQKSSRKFCEWPYVKVLQIGGGVFGMEPCSPPEGKRIVTTTRLKKESQLFQTW